GIRRDHRNPRLDEIIPILDLLGVSLAYQKYDSRGVWRAVLRQTLLPIGRNEPSGLRNSIDSVSQSQRYHVRLQAVDYASRLLARTSMRLLNRHCLAGLRLPIFSEGCVVVLVKLTGGIVRNIKQRNVLRKHRRRQHE